MAAGAVGLRGSLLLALFALALAGCGEDEGGGSGPYDSTLLGIWNIDSWTNNPSSCVTEGPSILDQSDNKKLLVQACTLNFGIAVDFLQALECTDDADCESKRCTESSLNLSGSTFESGNDDDGWRGTTIFAFGAPDDQCSGEVISHVLTADGDDLMLRQETVESGLFPQDAEGFCDTDTAQAQAKGMPCVALEVRRMSR